MSVNIKQNQPVCSTIYFRSMWAKHLQEHHHILFCYIFICVCRRYHTNKQAIHRRSTVVCCLDQTIQLMILMLMLLLLMLLLLLLSSSWIKMLFMGIFHLQYRLCSPSCTLVSDFEAQRIASETIGSSWIEFSSIQLSWSIWCRT